MALEGLRDCGSTLFRLLFEALFDDVLELCALKIAHYAFTQIESASQT